MTEKENIIIIYLHDTDYFLIYYLSYPVAVAWSRYDLYICICYYIPQCL